jgi:hypothetical protein
VSAGCDGVVPVWVGVSLFVEGFQNPGGVVGISCSDGVVVF